MLAHYLGAGTEPSLLLSMQTEVPFQLSQGRHYLGCECTVTWEDNSTQSLESL